MLGPAGRQLAWCRLRSTCMVHGMQLQVPATQGQHNAACAHSCEPLRMGGRVQPALMEMVPGWCYHHLREVLCLQLARLHLSAERAPVGMTAPAGAAHLPDPAHTSTSTNSTCVCGLRMYVDSMKCCTHHCMLQCKLPWPAYQ